MPNFEIRVDFFDKPATTLEGESSGYACSVHRAGFTGVVVPRVGESLAGQSLLPGPQGKHPFIKPVRPPFHVVRAVEHFPRPAGAGSEPSVTVLVHASLGYEGERLAELVNAYTAAGWTWWPAEHAEVARIVYGLDQKTG